MELDKLELPAVAKEKGIQVIIREIHKVDVPWDKHYIVACQIKEGDWTSHIFHLYPHNAQEFKEMIKKEIANYLKSKALLGEEVIRKV